MNYTLPEVMHMLTIVKKALPQGKNMWDAVAMPYNGTKRSHLSATWRVSAGSSSLCTGLYNPSGVADKPAHVAFSKDIKLIDEASSVLVTSENEGEEATRGRCQVSGPGSDPLRSFPRPVSGRSSLADSSPSPSGSGDSNGYDDRAHECRDCMSPEAFGGYESSGSLPPFELSDEPEPVVGSTLEVDENKEAPPSATSSEPAKLAPAPSARTSVPPAKPIPSKYLIVSSKQSSVISKAKSASNADARERLRYPTLSDNSDRPGGINLAEMRDTLKKRTYSEFEEASYTKQKRLNAEKAAVELKRKLDAATQNETGKGGDLVRTIMILRADADRADAARAEAAEAIRRE
ncbi:unnamed protein product [Phytophthora fragariaefolia]|uniref:Unnamed protein product n=1 Tax=Phytophthora fragariaefolia TaxID=1490495 RepID=A0A9W6XAW9_9STRA|nr:unnamed protein product [Phytophthora fragariaefolia]